MAPLKNSLFYRYWIEFERPQRDYTGILLTSQGTLWYWGWP
jgi:hypothetical protein